MMKLPAMHRLCLWAGLALLVWPLLPADANDTAGVIGHLETQYQETLADLEKSQQKSRTKTLKAYAAALEKLQASFKSKSDLDGILVVRGELARLEKENSLRISDIDADSDSIMADLQRKVISRLEQTDGEYAKQIVSFTQSYIRALDETQQKLVKADRISEAIQLKERSQQVLEEEPYRSAAAMIEEQRLAYEARRNAAMAKSEALKAEQDKFRQDASNRKQPDDPNRTEAILYPPGTPPPALRGARRENLLHTGTESRAAATRISGVVNVLSTDADEKESESGGYYNKWVGRRIIPRISISSGPDPIGRSTLVLQYFAKGSGSDRTEVHTEKISLPPMDNNQTVIIDAAGQAFYSDYLHVHSDGYKHSVSPSSYGTDARKVVGEYGGFILSVFEEDGTLAFQRCTQAALSEYAKSTP